MNTCGVGFFVGAGIPSGKRVNTFVECGCCGAYHRTDFAGDCREDSERFYELPTNAELVEREDDGTSGQDRESYTDDQDRGNYQA